MLFAEPGKYKPCGMFTLGHLELIVITVMCIIVALQKTVHKSKEEIKKIIQKCTIVMWCLEILKIAFRLLTGDPKNLNNYVPLYYCSMLLYAGIFSGFAKGKVQRIGDVFLATGGIIGGLVFMLMPTTSLPAYPAFHIVSLHSFFFHGTMVYLGILINVTDYIEVVSSDIKYFATLVGTMCIIAYIINRIFNSNLMFISNNFPGTPIEIIYKITGPCFTLVMSMAQMFLPFYTVYGIFKLRDKLKNKTAKELKEAEER